MNFHVATAFLTSIIVPAQGLFVLTRNPKQPANRTWCSLSVSVGLWSLAYALMISSFEYDRSLLWARVMEANGCIIPTLFLHFTYTLLQTTNHKRTVGIFYLIGGTLSLLALFTPLIVVTVKPKMEFPHYTHFGQLAWVYTIFFFSTVIFAHVKLWQGIKLSTSKKRNQLFYVFTAGVMGFGTGATAFPISFGFPMNDFGNLVFLYAFPITYAILKHQLMDITVVFRRTLVYSILTACLTASYFLFILIMERWFQTLVGYRSFLPTAAAAFLLAVSFIPLKNWIQAFVDRFFFKGSLPQLAAEQQRLRGHLRQADQEKAVTILAAGMAHEIKNPLATIKTFAEYLKTKYDDPSFRERFTKLVPEEVSKIDRIVQEVLMFARPAPPKTTAINLQTLTEETIEFLNTQLITQHIAVVRAYQTNDECSADPVQIKQVLLNLLLNSIEAMVEGGALTITIERADSWIIWTLQDTGHGIPKELLRQLGEPFITTKSNGTGLGLAVVRTILDAHGGRLTLESQPGAGTTASIRLPEMRTQDASHKTQGEDQIRDSRYKTQGETKEQIKEPESKETGTN